MNRVYITTLRFNLDKPDDRAALEYLQGVGKEEYKSLNRAVIAAVNDHFLRKARLAADPYLETRENEDTFLRRVRETIEQSLRAIPATTSTMPSVVPVSDSEEAIRAMDYIDPERFPEEYGESHADAMRQAEWLTCRLHHLIYETASIRKPEYLLRAAETLGIRLCDRESCGYMRLDLGNLELKRYLDVAAAYLLIDDSPKYMDLYQAVELGGRHAVEMFMMEPTASLSGCGKGGKALKNRRLWGHKGDHLSMDNVTLPTPNTFPDLLLTLTALSGEFPSCVFGKRAAG